jgi:hypothetical protein
LAWELEEEYIDRDDNLCHMSMTFTMAQKKFGLAEHSKGAQEIVKIIERFQVPKNDKENDKQRKFFPGRILDPTKIFERTYDFESNRIFIKFFHGNGQIFYKTVEFLAPSGSGTRKEEAEDLLPDDVNVYMVDLRDPKPCHYELRNLYREQLENQEVAIKRVEKSEVEMLEDRMKELSANELDVLIFDVKRNAQLSKGRHEKAKIQSEKEKSVLDIELDFLAPYLERFSDAESLTKTQATQIRDDCLINIKSRLQEKEDELVYQIDIIKREIITGKDAMTPDILNNKKFFLNVLNTRFARHKSHAISYYAKAEKKIINDPRLKAFL